MVDFHLVSNLFSIHLKFVFQIQTLAFLPQVVHQQTRQFFKFYLTFFRPQSIPFLGQLIRHVWGAHTVQNMGGLVPKAQTIMVFFMRMKNIN
jgi:hypothetical protein